MKKLKIDIMKTVEIDNFEKGCIGGSHDFGIIETKFFKNLSEVENFIDDFSCSGEAFIFENRVEFCLLEDRNGWPVELHDNTYKKFKAGKIDLWAANYSLYISEIFENEFDNTKLKENFNLKSEE